MAQPRRSLALPAAAGLVLAILLSTPVPAQLPDLPDTGGDPVPTASEAPSGGTAAPDVGAGEDRRDAPQARALLEPYNEAILSSELAAQVIEITVRDGERFQAGDVLVTFDCGTYEAELDAARATLFRAQRQLATLQQQANLGAVGALDVELARGEVLEAQAGVRSAELQVGRCAIAAPYDGIVVELLVHAYESVPAGQPLIEILDSGRLEVTIIIPSTWLAWLAPGELFFLEIDETQAIYEAEITKIGGRIDPISQTITVTGAIIAPHGNLIAGMSGTALFLEPESGAAD